MSEHPIELSNRIIDTGAGDAPNRVTNELSELAEGVALVESFSHSVAVDSGDGLVVFDTSGAFTGERSPRRCGPGRPTRWTPWSIRTATPTTSEGRGRCWPTDASAATAPRG